MAKESTTDAQRNRPGPARSTQLVLLRVWMDRKRASGGLEDLQGKVQDPISGQVQYFSGGMDLLQILCRMVLWKESSDPAAAAGDHKS